MAKKSGKRLASGIISTADGTPITTYVSYARTKGEKESKRREETRKNIYLKANNVEQHTFYFHLLRLSIRALVFFFFLDAGPNGMRRRG